MLQRIQTVWLLLAMGCSVLLFYVPVWQTASPSPTDRLTALGAGINFKLLGFPLMLFISHTIATWSFKNRRRQLRWCNINIMLFLLFLLAAFIILESENQIFFELNWRDLKLGFYLPFLGILFNVLARRGIRRDEQLIRNMHHLR
ncbi:MAG: DUF4293 domain-containing protein [Chitinophagales bacterium]|nr:DUF4293 domain-containing protein [Chitinophagales bacterium]MDW8427837.1 DUF4293 domain-containing protein [Chitinophagales bacterium]